MERGDGGDGAVVAARANVVLRDLGLADRPYARTTIPPRGVEGAATDEAGIPLYTQATTTSYHPVQVAQQALTDLEGHRLSGDPAFLSRAQRALDRLLAESIPVDDAVFFPYRFDFALGGDPNDVMHAPWYSAMAQGQALSGFVRLHATVGEPRYMDAAVRTLRSMEIKPIGSAPWVTFVDREGYLWFEEYAKDPPMQVLNGHIFAIFGLYDYWQVTRDARVAASIEAGLATVCRYADAFRDEGQISRYCLRVPGIRSAKYHGIHQDQLRMLSRMTAEPWFAAFADELQADYPRLRHHVIRVARAIARRLRRRSLSRP